MLDRLRRFIRNAGQPRESDTERDGFLSYAKEVHSLGLGVYHGLTSRPWRFRAEQYPGNPDIQAEPHYFAGGYAVGTVVQWAILLTVGQQAGVTLPV